MCHRNRQLTTKHNMVLVGVQEIPSSLLDVAFLFSSLCLLVACIDLVVLVKNLPHYCT